MSKNTHKFSKEVSDINKEAIDSLNADPEFKKALKEIVDEHTETRES